jgi:hypothetical protein
MTRRTKLAVCLGLLAVLVVGAVMVRRPAKPDIEMSFVRYATNGKPVLNFTKQGQGPVWLLSLNHRGFSDSELSEGAWSLWPLIELAPLSGTQVVARFFPTSPPLVRGETVFVQCMPQPSPLRGLLQVVLSKVGLNIASTGTVCTGTLPAPGSTGQSYEHSALNPMPEWRFTQQC